MPIDIWGARDWVLWRFHRFLCLLPRIYFSYWSKLWLTRFFWVVTSCRLVGGYERFGETYCSHLQGLDVGSSMFSPKFWYLLNSLPRHHSPKELHPHRHENLRPHKRMITKLLVRRCQICLKTAVKWELRALHLNRSSVLAPFYHCTHQTNLNKE
jgi:hypothetical protein